MPALLFRILDMIMRVMFFLLAVWRFGYGMAFTPVCHFLLNGTQVQLLDGNNQVLSTVNIESTGGLTYKGAITPTEWNPIDGEIGIGTPAAVLGDMYIASQAGYVNGSSLPGRDRLLSARLLLCRQPFRRIRLVAESWDDWNAQHPNTWDFIDINASASGNKIDGPATSSPNQDGSF